jgi:hypothetical protein
VQQASGVQKGVLFLNCIASSCVVISEHFIHIIDTKAAHLYQDTEIYTTIANGSSSSELLGLAQLILKFERAHTESS